MPSESCKFCDRREDEESRVEREDEESRVEHLDGCPTKSESFEEAKKSWEEGYRDGQTNATLKPKTYLSYLLGYFTGAHQKLDQ